MHLEIADSAVVVAELWFEGWWDAVAGVVEQACVG